MQPIPEAGEIERLVAALAGVVDARVITDAAGAPEEIHVAAEAGLHPKQVVRNVESALNARFGLDLDRRIISVAPQVADVVESESRGAPPPAPACELRLRYTGFQATMRAGRDVSCSVSLARGAHEYTGTAGGPDTPAGRAEAGARALFEALRDALGSDVLALEGLTLLQAHGRTVALVSARALEGRETVALVGVAPIERSAEEAAILAALQATNRWVAGTDAA